MTQAWRWGVVAPAVGLLWLAGAAAAQDARREEEPPAKPEPRLTAPPEIIEAAAPIYPAEAAAAGLEAKVLVRISIDATGAVTDVTVLEPVGHGFDEAAVAAARQYRFKPAEWDGVPGPIAVETTIHFELTEVEEPPPLPPEAPPDDPAAVGPPAHGGDARQPISIEGRALERGSRRRLAGVVVAIGGLGIDAVTGEDGRFWFHGVPPGAYELVAVDEQFDRFRRSLAVGANEVVEVVLYLRAKGGNPYETVVEGEREVLEVTRRTLNRRQMVTVPGTFGDPIRVVQTLPGLARTPFVTGFLIVRGSNPDDSGVYIDGHLVPLLFHFLGGPSILNAEFLEQLDLYPGGFPVRFGRAIGGIVSVETRSPKSDGVHGAADVDLLDSGGYLRFPVGDHGAVAVAGRRSYLDFMLGFFLPEAEPGQTLVVVPVYWDYQARFDYDLKSDGQLSLFAFGSDDKLDVLQVDAAAEQSFDLSTHIGFSRLIAAYRRTIAGGLRLTLSPAYGRDVLSFGGGQTEGGPLTSSLEVSQTAASYRMRVDGLLRKGLRLDTGIDLESRVTKYSALAPDDTNIRNPGSGQVEVPAEQIDVSIEGLGVGLYAELAWDVGGGVRLIPGARVDGYLLAGEARLSFDPRLVVRWTLDDQWTAKGYLGLFHQAPQPEGFDSRFGNPELGLEEAVHSGVGAEWRPAENWLIDGEIYYTDRNDIAIFTNDAEVDPDTGEVRPLNFVNRAEDNAYGFELLVKREVTRNLYGWLSYTLAWSERRRDPTDPESMTRPTLFDQRHNLNLVASYRTGGGWELGARFRLVTGGPRSEVLGATYDVDDNDYDPLIEDFRGARNPTFHQLDLRVEKTWVFDTWMMGVYLDVQNALDVENTEAIQYDYRYRASAPVTGVPLIPTLGIRGEW